MTRLCAMSTIRTGIRAACVGSSAASAGPGGGFPGSSGADPVLANQAAILALAVIVGEEKIAAVASRHVDPSRIPEARALQARPAAWTCGMAPAISTSPCRAQRRPRTSATRWRARAIPTTMASSSSS